jgi:hypothetical protein
VIRKLILKKKFYFTPGCFVLLKLIRRNNLYVLNDQFLGQVRCDLMVTNSWTQRTKIKNSLSRKYKLNIKLSKAEQKKLTTWKIIESIDTDLPSRQEIKAS